MAGAKLVPHPTRPGELAIEGIDPEVYSFSSLTLDVNEQGVISEERVTQVPTPDGYKVQLDDNWVKQQPSASFPMVIDPTFYRYDTSMSINMYKSDGYACNKYNCYINTGTLSNNGWKHWRSYFHFDYRSLAGKTILDARINMPMVMNAGGENGGRWMNIGWPHCVGYHCLGQW